MSLISEHLSRWRGLLAALAAVGLLAATMPQVSMAQSVSGGSISGSNAKSSKASSKSSGGDLESVTANAAGKAKTIMGLVGAVLAGAVMLYAFFIERSGKLVGLAALGCVVGGLAISGGLWQAGEKTGNDLLNGAGGGKTAQGKVGAPG